MRDDDRMTGDDDADWGPDDRVGLGPDDGRWELGPGDDDDQLWAMHPVIDDDLTAEEARHWAAIQAIAAAELAALDLDLDLDLDHCRCCGTPLDAEDGPFTYCPRCLPAAMAAEPWPLPSECP